MNNYDEPILRRRAVDTNAPFPILHQALRIALYDEYAARSFHARMVEAFGPQPPFDTVVQSQERRIATLSALCQRFGVPRPLDPFPLETAVGPSWLANCQRAVAGTIQSARLYESLLANIAEPEVRAAFLTLQAALLQQYLPPFRQAVLDAVAKERYHAAHGIPPQQAYVHHGAISDFLEKAFAQLGPRAGPLGVLSPLLRQMHPAMLAGMVAGGTGVYLWKNRAGPTQREN